MKSSTHGKSFNTCYIGIGSNLGNREDNINRALKLLEQHPEIRVVRVSSYHETAPVGISDPLAPDFLNAAAALETNLSPHEIMEFLKEIERKMGKTALSPDQAAVECKRRRKNSFPYQSRSIDLDILLYEDRVINDPDLTIPHPRMWERDFVMKPLREIHPGLGTVEK